MNWKKLKLKNFSLPISQSGRLLLHPSGYATCQFSTLESVLILLHAHIISPYIKVSSHNVESVLIMPTLIILWPISILLKIH